MTALNFVEFQQALAAARDRFSKIREKYPDLNGYLVLALRGQQTNLENSLDSSISEYPSILIDGPPKSAVLLLIKEAKDLEKHKQTEGAKSKKSVELEIENIKQDIAHLLEELEFDGGVQVEIRFHNLVYDLIWRLQADDLVDRNLTPQSKASIRIVLGTISQMQARDKS